MLYSNVKKLCEDRKIAVTRLESELGFSRGSICKWSEVDPGISKVKKVADYFSVPVDYFLTESEKNEVPSNE